MTEWWNGLDGVLQVLYCITIPSTIILILQTLFTLAGGGNDIDISDTSGLDIDTDALHGHIHLGWDADFDTNMEVSDLPSLRLFTVQGLVAFLCIAGWTGIITYGTMSLGISLGMGVILGVTAMFIIAKVMQVMPQLNQSGTLDYRNALGETARVYLVIPERGQGMGKVNITVQGSLLECNAVSRGERIDTGSIVRVIDLEEDVLVVEKVGGEEEDKI